MKRLTIAVISLIITSSVHAEVICTNNILGSLTVKQNTEAVIGGDYEYTIENPITSMSETYNVDETLCIENNNCSSRHTSKTLKPYSQEFYQDSLQITPVMPDKGQFEIESTLKISSDNGGGCTIKTIKTLTVD